MDKLPDRYFLWFEHNQPNIWYVARSKYPYTFFECYVVNPVRELPLIGWNILPEKFRWQDGERCHIEISETEALLIIIGGKEVYLQIFQKYCDLHTQTNTKEV